MSVQNFSFLARLEVAEKFVVGWWWWSRPSLGLSFSQAEQYLEIELTYLAKISKIERDPKISKF